MNSKKKSIESLEQLGLGESEATLYTILIKYGETSVQELQKHSPFPRTLLYHILNRLILLGLVTFIQKPRRTVYIAEDPEKLYDLLADREKEFKKNKDLLQETIPELRNQYRLSQSRPGIRMFEGIERYREALDDIIQSRPSCVYSYIDVQEKNKPGLRVREQMNKERIAWGIEEKILLHDNAETKTWFQKQEKESSTSYKFIPNNLDPFAIDLRLYDNKVVQTSYEGTEPTVTMIENKQLFDMQKSIFNFFWKSL